MGALERLRRLLQRGFVGPRYEGLIGKARFAWHRFVSRVDVMLIATPETAIRSDDERAIDLVPVERFAAIAPHAASIDAAFGTGHTERWRRIFDWGEILFLLRHDGRIVAFRWVQMGRPGGFPYSAGTLFPGHARITRGAVFPAERRAGYNTVFHRLLLQELFRRGVTVVHADCSADNLPSLRSLEKAGYQAYRRLRVHGPLLGATMRWLD